MRVPPLPPRVPSRGNAFTRALGRLLLSPFRFEFDGTLPDEPRSVMIVAPHTSNWDFPVGLGAMFALGLRARWLGKHTIFRPAPVAAIFRWAGGLPVDRTSPDSTTIAVRELFGTHERLMITLAPEGTRFKVARWKTGFYRMALAGNVPILPVAFDWSRRRIVLMPAFRPTGNYEADVAALMSLFSREMAYRPEYFWA